METWLLFALLSALTAALVAIFGKIGLEGVDSTVATTVRALIMLAVLVIVLFATNKAGEVTTVLTNSRTLMFIALSGVSGALSWLFYFFALKVGEASRIAPIDRLSIVFVVILAFLVLGEKVSLKTALGTGLMAVGAILVALG